VGQLELFEHRLPWHGLGTDNLDAGLHIYDKFHLVLKAIVQFNAKHSIGWLVYDVDSTTARFDWYDRSNPPPNILAINRDNGHAHYFYGLIKPVHDYTGAKDAPLRYLAAVDVALTEELEADPGYSKLLSKNPLHVRWEVLYPRDELYDLDELASWVDMEKYRDKRRRLPAIGYGRNCTLFETLRVWAYSARRRESFLSEEMFRHAVLNHAHGINAEFQPPLPHSEVRATAKSVSRWVWRKMSDKGFTEWQRVMGRRSGVVRKTKSMELRESIIKTREQCPDLSQADIAALHGVSRQTVNTHLRGVNRTISDKASLSGPTGEV
jgi:DNA-binding CsgD family transcriptional regulator